MELEGNQLFSGPFLPQHHSCFEILFLSYQRQRNWQTGKVIKLQSAMEGGSINRMRQRKKTLGAGMQSTYIMGLLKLKIEVCVKLDKRIVFRESENHQ